jgi:hypothetical protein
MTTQELLQRQHNALMEAHQYFTRVMDRNYPVPNCAIAISNAVRMYEEFGLQISREDRAKKLLTGSSYGVNKALALAIVDIQDQISRISPKVETRTL